jgi:hypothetical protein
MNELKQKEKTRALRAAIKADLVPFMAQLGFARIKRGMALPPEEYNWSNTYNRKRDEYFDELHIEWRSLGRPLFMLEFWTSQTEKMLKPEPVQGLSDLSYQQYYARFLPGKRGWQRCRGWPFFFHEFEPWYGDHMSVEDTIKTAKLRIADLDSYLRTGEPFKFIDLVDGVAVKGSSADPSSER